MQRANVTSLSTIRNTREAIRAQFEGTDISFKSALEGGTKALRSGTRGGEVSEILELALGARVLRGGTYEQNVERVAQAFATGQGGALGIPTYGNQTLEFNRDILRGQLAPAAETARNTFLNDPSLTGGADLLFFPFIILKGAKGECGPTFLIL